MEQMTDFLEKVQGLPECGLIISSDIEKTTSWLVEKGFNQIEKISEIKSDNQYFVILDRENTKKWYDFCIQFSTGEIQYADEDIQKLLSLDPLDTSIVLIIREGEFVDPDIRKVTGVSISI